MDESRSSRTQWERRGPGRGRGGEDVKAGGGRQIRVRQEQAEVSG